MLSLLVTQIVLLEDRRETVRSQRAILKSQSRKASPALEDVQPLLRDARAAQPWLRQAGSRLDRLTRNAAPLVTDLRAARAGDAARATISLADDLLDADIGRATQSVAQIAGVTGELQSALRETRERDLLRRAATAADAVPELLRLQRQTLGILQQSLAIQRSTERHAASLDRKTGGTAPVAPPTPAPLP